MDVSINKKAQRIFCAAAVAGMLALGAGCDDGGNPNSGKEAACYKTVAEPDEPQSSCLPPHELVPYQAYLLTGSPCEWAPAQLQLSVSEYSTDVTIINSDEELARYVECAGGNYPKINFSKHTLLLAYGKEEFMVNWARPIHLTRRSDEQSYYSFAVEVRLAMPNVITFWQVPIIVDKMPKGSTVELSVIKNKVANGNEGDEATNANGIKIDTLCLYSPSPSRDSVFVVQNEAALSSFMNVTGYDDNNADGRIRTKMTHQPDFEQWTYFVYAGPHDYTMGDVSEMNGTLTIKYTRSLPPPPLDGECPAYSLPPPSVGIYFIPFTERPVRLEELTERFKCACGRH